MALFEKALRATVMSTELFINSNVSKKLLYACLELAKEFETTYSAYQESSLLSKINSAAGSERVVCSPDELEIFRKALSIAKISDGKFDPTIGALTQGLYGFGMQRAKIPTQNELQERKKLLNYNLVEIQEDTIYLKKSGMRLDLGAIGKGYVADKIIEKLLESGATKALVSVGGEICSFGKSYNIALQDPFSEKNIGVIQSSKKPLSISTSGDYERFIGSKEHHHILDTQSAKPQHYYSSVTLLQNGIDATTLDGVATIVFNSPPEELEALAKKFAVAIVVITPQKRIIIENFEMLDIEQFTLYPFT